VNERRFNSDRSAGRLARRFVAETLEPVDPDDLEIVTLMVSELVTNSIRHARSAFRVSVDRSDGRIRVEVSDEGEGTPTMQEPDTASLSGRGLRLVDTLSEAWGVIDHGTTGKTVWFTIRERTLSSTDSHR
jgi:anti-sigma regulatory factor (Ser/Thr protein kinase)